MQFLTLLQLASLSVLASAQIPFTVMTRSVPSSVASKVESDLVTYLTGVYDSPQWTSIADSFAVEAPDLAADVDGDPVSYANAFLTATATPAWYSELPSDVQSFVSSVAAAQATIAAKDSGASSQQKGVWVGGAMIAAGAVAVALL